MGETDSQLYKQLVLSRTRSKTNIEAIGNTQSGHLYFKIFGVFESVWKRQAIEDALILIMLTSGMLITLNTLMQL